MTLCLIYLNQLYMALPGFAKFIKPKEKTKKWNDTFNRLVDLIEISRTNYDVTAIFKIIGAELSKIGLNLFVSVIDDSKKNILIRYLNIFGEEMAALNIKIPFENISHYSAVLTSGSPVFSLLSAGHWKNNFDEAGLKLNFEDIAKLNSIVTPITLEREIIGFFEIISSELRQEDVKIIAQHVKKITDKISHIVLFQEIKKSEKMYRDLFSNAKEGFFIMDLRRKRFIEVNQGLVEITGYTKDELRQMNLVIIFHEDDRKKINALLKEWRDNPSTGVLPKSFEIRVKTKDGRVKYIKFTVTRIINQNEWFCIIYDRTEKILAERTSKENEAMYQRLIHSGSSLILRIDTQGKINFFNKYAQRFFGYREKEIIGKNFFETVALPAAASDKNLKNLINDAVEHPERHLNDLFENINKNGQKVWISWQLKPIYDVNNKLEEILCLGTDLTDFKKAQLALSRNEERYRSLVAATTQIVWTTNPSGEVVNDIPLWRKFTGQNLSEIKGWGWAKALHPDDREKTIKIWSEAVKGRKLYDTEYRLLRRDKQYRYMTVRGVPVLENDGIVREWIGTCTDITEQKSAERALKRSESSLAKAQKITHIGNWDWDIKDNALFWSDEIYRIFGLKPREFGATYEAFLSYVHPDDRRLVEQAVSQALEKSKDYSIEHRIVLPNGKIRFVHEIGEIKLDRLGKPARMLGTVQDITERRELESYREFTNSLFKLFVVNASRKEYLKAVVDLLHGWSGCRCVGIRMLNHDGAIPYESYRGFSQEFWQSENCLSLKNDQCACTRVISGQIETQDRAMMTPGGSFRCGNTFKYLDGLSGAEKNRFRGVCVKSGFASLAIIPISHSGKIIGAIHLADEIEGKASAKLVEKIELVSPLIGEAIHRFNVEEELKSNQEKYKKLSEFNQRILDTAPYSVITIDKKGILTYVNKHFSNFSSSSSPLNRDVFKLPFFINEGLCEPLKKLLADGTPFAKENCRTVNSKGETKYLNVIHVPLRGADGEINGALSMAVDNSEAYEANKKLEAWNQELEQKVIKRTKQLDLANKKLAKALDLKIKFIADASHELRTPLTVIQGNLDLARMGVKKMTSQDKEFLEVISKEVHHMTGILSDLTALARSDDNEENITYEKVNMTKLVNASILSLKAVGLKNNISLEYLEKDLVEIMGDEAKLEKLLLNILRNAIKYNKENGSVKVWLEYDRQYARIFVADSGLGIADKDLPYIFERFYRSDNARSKSEGSGLGLSICKSIVEAHKGIIEVESKLGEGSVFIIHLPIDYKQLKKNSLF